MGNRKHDCDNPNAGVYATKSRAVSSYDPSKLAVCPGCKVGVVKTNLYNHRKRCPVLKNEGHLRGTHMQYLTFAQLKKGDMDAFTLNVIQKMKNDDIRKTVEGDKTILMYGASLFSEYSDKPHLRNSVSSKLRDLGRMLLEARKIAPKIKTLEDLLDPHNWTLLKESVCSASGFNPDDNSFTTPSLALRLGGNVAILLNVLETSALINCNSQQLQRYDYMKRLLRGDFRRHIAKKAHRTLRNRKFRAPKRAPLAADIQKLYAYLKEQIKQKMEMLKADPTHALHWNNLAKVTVAYLVTYNRRRPGETARLLVKDAQRICDVSTTDPELMKVFSQAEKLHASSLKMINLPGKKDRVVPLLFNPLSYEATTLLIKHRLQCGIIAENPHVFAVAGTKVNTIRADVVIREAAESCGAEDPLSLRATQLRKNVATTCQLLALNEHELDVLAKFMGHDINVHRQFYRLSDDAIQLARLSKVFSLLDEGKLQLQEGKTLAELQINVNDINIDEEVNVEENSEDITEEITDQPTSKTSGTKRKRRKASNVEDDTTDEEVEPLEPLRPKATPSKQRNMQGREPWLAEESEAIDKHFGSLIRKGIQPGMEEISTVKAKEPRLAKRTSSKIYHKIRNILSKAKQ
ncbi:uncharacterized protein LOC113215712 [Frankliniella occidentalis]|uniref:Uncharacterized protein LOC113215712 n=1 Tax=Frankliniella occidentalis TaxID=133901 RepID=A0A6J1TC69_FRAOC|nr:uncharacterized protein LOC113215712 [Frankliniella occidentalis]